MANYFKNIYDGIATAWEGMRITFGHLIGPKVTNQYPDTYHPIKSGDMPSNSRNRIFVDMDNCDGCDACARVCPVNCITVESTKVVPGDKAPDLANGKKRKTWVLKHEIDFAKCFFCSLCTEACPTYAIVMTQEFEYSSYQRDGLIYNFAPFNEEEAKALEDKYEAHKEQKKREKAEKKKKEREAKKKEEQEAKEKEGSESKAAAKTDEEKQKEREARRKEREEKRKARQAAKEKDSKSDKTGNGSGESGKNESN